MHQDDLGNHRHRTDGGKGHIGAVGLGLVGGQGCGLGMHACHQAHQQIGGTCISLRAHNQNKVSIGTAKVRTVPLEAIPLG